ncbi:TPA: zinc-binding dehydrogenase [Enterococcus faecium]
MKALYFSTFGSSEVLRYGELPKPKLGEQEVLVQTEYIGLNFADIYRRRGTYHIEKHSPYINGYEGAGTIVDAGSSELKALIDKKVLFVDVPFANAEFVAVPVEKLIFLPDRIGMKEAATIGLQGLTADFLAHDLGNNAPGDKVFITGISGGVGQLLSQILIADGVRVFGSASTKEKQEIALSLGAEEVFSSRETDWQAANNNRFDTVFDGVGKTLESSIELLHNRGKVIFFGMAGGNPPAIDLVDMLAHSKSILTGDLWDYLSSFEEREKRSERLFSYLTNNKIVIHEPTIFSLKDGKTAHEYLESGKNIGKVLLKTKEK